MSRRIHPAISRRCEDRWVSLNELRKVIRDEKNCVLVDRKVARLHDLDGEAMLLTAGERVKSFAAFERICAYVQRRKLDGAQTVVAVGGGTIGDVASLAAHMVKRGMPLIHVPSTLLAAVDSSIGGKAAINARDGAKNVYGAFHFPDECLLVPELWTTLEPKQRTEGIAEAVKMVLCLDRATAEKWAASKPDIDEIVSIGRNLKHAICEKDPFDVDDIRAVLNFGHTTAHALEMLSNHRVSHGLAVAAGMRAALDIGLAVGITPDGVASEAESLLDHFQLPGRELLAETLSDAKWSAFLSALKQDKKGFLRFVILEEIGKAGVHEVEQDVVRDLFNRWRRK